MFRRIKGRPWIAIFTTRFLRIARLRQVTEMLQKRHSVMIDEAVRGEVANRNENRYVNPWNKNIHLKRIHFVESIMLIV